MGVDQVLDPISGEALVVIGSLVMPPLHGCSENQLSAGLEEALALGNVEYRIGHMFERLVCDDAVDRCIGEGHRVVRLENDVHAGFGGGGDIGGDIAGNVRCKQFFIGPPSASIVEHDSTDIGKSDFLHPLVEVMENQIVVVMDRQA